jgi:hypothetical protein
MTIDIFETLIEDIYPEDLDENQYTSIGTINIGFIDVYKEYFVEGDYVTCTIECNLGTWKCLGIKEYDDDIWKTTIWNGWEKE